MTKPCMSSCATKGWALIGPKGKIYLMTIAPTETDAWGLAWCEIGSRGWAHACRDAMKPFNKEAMVHGYRVARVLIEEA